MKVSHHSEESPGEPTPGSPEQTLQLEFHAQKKASGILGEFLHFLLYTKKWWLLPVILALLFVSLLIVIAGSAVAPFIYPLF